MEAVRKERRYTYADYLEWDDGNRYELIDGEAYLMASPTYIHQRISMNLAGELFSFLKGKPCRVLSAPFDVRLNSDKADDIVVQPDILVVCDKDKLSDKYCAGAPDFVIEILSPSTLGKDRVTKFNAYLNAGVREYWIVDPESKTASVYILENGRYIAHAYDETSSIPVTVLEGCAINLADIFD